MADYGIKISKSGFPVLTADKNDQIFNSEANSLKIWATGNVNISVSAASGFGTATVAHNLSYEPFFLVYFKLKHASKLWFQDSQDDSRLLANFNSGMVNTDSTNLNLRVNTDEASDWTATAYYIIFIDKAYE